MNWQRGLVRLWLVLAAIWIVSIAVYASAVSIHYNQLPTADQLFGSDCSGSIPPTWCFAQDSWLSGTVPAPIWKYVLLALVPPTLVLALGFGIRWVRHGFGSGGVPPKRIPAEPTAVRLSRLLTIASRESALKTIRRTSMFLIFASAFVLGANAFTFYASWHSTRRGW